MNDFADRLSVFLFWIFETCIEKVSLKLNDWRQVILSGQKKWFSMSLSENYPDFPHPFLILF